MRIACVGDSITQGACLANPAMESYPAQLAALLKPEHTVGNFGLSGSTMTRKGDLPYFTSAQCAQARDFKPDAVVIKLGTNDTKPHNWVNKAQFVDDCAAIVDIFRTASTNPDIWLCLPVPVYAAGLAGINSVCLAEVLAMVRDAAARKKAQLIDLHTPLSGHPEFFPDTVHPNASGAAVIAKTVAAALTGKK